MQQKRKKIWIDRFQTSLSLRIAVYFVLYQAAVWSLAVIEHSLVGTLEGMLGRSWAVNFLYMLGVVVVALGVLFIYDAVKTAHRIVGPLSRFRQTIKAITSGDELELIRLRQGDYLQEMKDELNEMIKVLEQRGAVVMKTPGAEQTQHEPVSV
jgi:sensor histidine kinase YesM